MSFIAIDHRAIANVSSNKKEIRMETISHVVVPGTYDPITLGHLDVIKRAAGLFPQVTVAVAESIGKGGRGPIFSLEERVELVEAALDEVGAPSNVEVVGFTGLLVDFCHQIGAGGIVKGLRAATDFEYELQQADLNFRMAPDLESVFIMSNPSYGFVSSSMVREIASFGSDVSLLVPHVVEKRLHTFYDK